MIKIKTILLLIFALCLGLISGQAIADQQVTPQQTFTDASKAIRVSSDKPSFTINVKSNPSTGYSWVLLKHSRLIKPVSRKYVAPDTKLMGAGGYEQWIFTVDPKAFVVPRRLKVVLAYRRPWEVKHGGKQVFVIVTQH